MSSQGFSDSSYPDDTVELEAMRKEDSSWHPCQVSLSSTGVGLIVAYGNTASEDIIENEGEANARLRIRSIPLHGDDCVQIQEGEHVLATQNSQSKSLFFDATVEKAVKVRHSKKVHCRCTFTVKWLHQDLKGGILTVSSGSIMKLATKSINLHPIICAFLSNLENLGGSSTSPLPTIIEDMDCEVNLHEMLEKQIEEISTSASKKRISDNILLGFEDDNAVVGSKVSKSRVQVPPHQNHLRRITRSTNKLQMETEVNDPPPPAPSIQEELLECRSPLNPLAARAALASLMSKMPQNLEVPIYHEEKLDYSYLSDKITCKLDLMQSMNGTKLDNFSTGNNFSMTGKLSLLSPAASVPSGADANKDVKLFISTTGAPANPQLIDAYSGILTDERESEIKTSEIPDSRENFICSVARRKLSQPPKATKLTCSATKRGDGMILDDALERKTCAKQRTLLSSTNPRRLTRSAVNKIKEIQTMEANQGVEEQTSGKYANSDSADQNIGVLESYALKYEKSISSQIDPEAKSLSIKERKSLVEEEEGNKKQEVERKTRASLRNSTSMNSLTRSAVHEEGGNKTTQAKHGLQVDKLAQNKNSNSSEGNVTAAKRMVFKTTKRTSSLLDDEGDLSPIEKKLDGGKMSSAAKNTRNNEGNGESSRSLKRKCTSLKKQELRYSPRLRFLPRTRSHNKS